MSSLTEIKEIYEELNNNMSNTLSQIHGLFIDCQNKDEQQDYKNKVFCQESCEYFVDCRDWIESLKKMKLELKVKQT